MAPCNWPFGVAQRLDVACVRPAFPLHAESHGFASDRAAMGGDGRKVWIRCFEIIEERHAYDLVRFQAQARESCAERRSEPKIFVNRPEHRGQLLHQHAQPRFAFADFFFGAFSFDREGDLAADRGEEFQVALRVGVFVLVMLHHENADSGGGGAQRHAQPGRRRRPYQLYFPCCRKLIENLLRNQHRTAGTIDIRRATSAHLLRRRRLVKLVHEERKVEHSGSGLVQRHETILRVQDFVQRHDESGRAIRPGCR